MKTIRKQLLATALLCLPALLPAQWGAVRFDQVNIFHKVFAASTNTVFALGHGPTSMDHFMVRTNDGGVTWDSIGLSTATEHYDLNELFFRTVNEGYAGGSKNGNQVLLKSIDNGTTWTDITPDASSTEPLAAVHFVDAMNGFAGAGTNFYTTTNGGVSWTTQTVLPRIEDIVFADAMNGFISGNWNSDAVVYRTTNGGASWSLSLFEYNSNLFVSSFHRLDMTDADTIFTYMPNTNRMYRTVDAGLSWDTLICDSVDYIQDVDWSNSNTVHVLSQLGQIYVSPDASNSWAMEYATDWGFYGPSIYLFSISFVDEMGYVCGTSGLIKRHEGIESIGEQPLTLEANFYPNPSNGNEALHVVIPQFQGETVFLKIYSCTGQLMENQVIYQVPRNGTGDVSLQLEKALPAGIYHVVIESGNQTATGKLVVSQ